MKIISACLLGVRCAWSGDDKYKNERAIELSKVEPLIPVCPEQLGGLPTPRVPQEIQGGKRRRCPRSGSHRHEHMEVHASRCC